MGVVRVMYLLRMAEITSGSSFDRTETGVCLILLESENDLEKKSWTLKSNQLMS